MKPAKRAFDHCADEYARCRPTYPDGLLDAIELRTGEPAGRFAADVGAGTGIFSCLLAGRGWNVLAVEPSEAMLDCMTTPVHRLCASAELTALAAASVELVTAAQAFHWFNPPYALAEFARILQPGGVLALLWNNRDGEQCPFVEAYESLIARYNPTYKREYRQQNWAAKIAATNLFAPAQYERFDHEWTLSAEELVGFSRSVSYIRNVVPHEQLPRFEDELRTLARNHYGDVDCRIPLRTDLWTAQRT